VPDAWSVIDAIRDSGTTFDLLGNPCPAYFESLSAEEGEALYEQVRRIRPSLIIECGCQHACSTLYMLQGLADNQHGRLISIDPNEMLGDHPGVGLANIRRAGLESWHECLLTGSEYALPDLCRKRSAVDFAFIDSSHMFDQTIVELYFLNRMLRLGGMIGLHDYFLPGIYTALQFLLSNLPYSLTSTTASVSFIEKQAADGRPWWHFVHFQSSLVSCRVDDDRLRLTAKLDNLRPLDKQ